MPKTLPLLCILSLSSCLLACNSGDGDVATDTVKAAVNDSVKDTVQDSAQDTVQDTAKKIGSTLNDKQALEINEIPALALQSIKAMHPDFVPTAVEKEYKHGKTYLDIEGEASGAEIEFDFLQTANGWEIVEIQRDLSWEELPPLVAIELKTKAPLFEPQRIIESQQHGTSTTVYEFYAVDSAGVESRKEVKLQDDIATLLEEEWQH